MVNNWKLRLTGAILILATLWYIPWLLSVINWEAPWLSLPFVVANLLVATMATLTVVNNWTRSVPNERLVEAGREPQVAVVIPTLGEPTPMIKATVESVLNQNWPKNRLVIVVSDDAKRKSVLEMVITFGKKYPQTVFHYLVPPAKESKQRRGEGKAGNLNSAFSLLVTRFPEIAFLETRDADDLVGDRSFLRQCVGQMQADRKVGFVQTIKEAIVPENDPFGHQEKVFYLGVMYSKNAREAVFSCGSGVVWRVAALKEVGGFADWNLVEDLETSYEIIQKRWKPLYLPIVGAVAQGAPSDIEAVIKQRWQWAVDTLRLFLYKSPFFADLSFWQKLHFAELGFFYLLSFASLVFTLTPVVSLVFGLYPLVTNHFDYAVHLWLYAATIEVFLGSMAGIEYEALWRSRQMWLGLAPVYAGAFIVTIIKGPNKKPKYKVTRKVKKHRVYFKETAVQMLMCVALLGAIAWHLSTKDLSELDFGTMFWASFFVLLLAGVVRSSWYGVDIKKEIEKMTRPLFVPRYALGTLIVIALLSMAATFVWSSIPMAEAVGGIIPPAYADDSYALGARTPTKVKTPMLATRTPVPTQNPRGVVGLGAYLDGTPYDDFQATENFESLVGHQMTYTLWFQAWGDGDRDFMADRVLLASQKGLVPVITWEPWRRLGGFETGAFDTRTNIQEEYSFQSIIDGNHDEYIRSWARGAKATGVGMIIRFAHEQSTDVGARLWYPWQGDPEGYKGAFRHIVAIFREEGATNVTFVWSAMWLANKSAHLYYPGDDVTDWIGTTTLNHGYGANVSWATWFTFDYLFGSQYAAAKKYGKPIMLTELASAEQCGSDARCRQNGGKPRWIKDTFASLKTRYPLVAGVLLFEVAQDREWPSINWSVASSDKSLEAFRSAIADPYFR